MSSVDLRPDNQGNSQSSVGSKRVGTIVKELRSERRWSLQFLARRSGVSPMQLSRIERLKSSPTEEKIRALSQAFDVPISVLFDDNLLERALSGVMTSLLSVESRLVDSRIRVRALQTMGRYGLKDAFETAQRGGRIRSTRAEQDSLRFELTKPDDV